MGADRARPPLVRIVWGTGAGPTGVAAYDAALADAGVHNFNLVTVSSIVPAGAAVEAVGMAPDLGPAGHRLTVVQSRATAEGPGRATAGLGWATGDGPGLIYEAAGDLDEAVAVERIGAGLRAARGLRDWTLDTEDYRVVSTTAEAGEHASAVVLAAFGEGEPVF